jgi:Cu(I)/Ag(I) efflux system membrane fusion protein
VQVGSSTQVTVDAYPGSAFSGRVDFIYPTLNSATRTVQVRMEINNPKGLLKPAMFVNAQIAIGKGEKVLTVPVSAVIDSGLRQIVLVQLAQGRFEPREVRLGSRSENYVEVLDGIAEGEQVVTTANFLIDAESNLRSALSGMGGPVRQAQDRQAASTQTPAAEQRKEIAQPKTAVVGHQAQGTLEAVNADGTVSITHGPIATLGWPGMTMDFALANSALLDGIQPGSAIMFEIVERKPDEWVITKLQARAQHQQHEGH